MKSPEVICLAVTEQDRQRQLDRATVDSLKLLPCPRCTRNGYRTPLIYRGKNSGRWMMRSGPMGCQHMDQPVFKSFEESADVLAQRWNAWVEDEKTRAGL